MGDAEGYFFIFPSSYFLIDRDKLYKIGSIAETQRAMKQHAS